MKNTFKNIITLLLIISALLSMLSCDIVEIQDIDSDTDDDIKDIDTNNPTQTEEMASISETVCFEYEGIKVSAKEIVKDMIWGSGIKLLIENNSSKDYSVGVEQLIINNCMVTDLFSATVASGKKANETLYFFTSDLVEAKISNIGLIEIYFYICDPNTYETIYETDCITIKTSHYDKMDTLVEDAGHVLYEGNDIKIVGKYIDEYTMLGKAVALYIENSSDKNITVSCDQMSINGFMVTGFLYETIYTGKYSITDITILSSDLEDNSITKINEFELKFEIRNADTYDTIVITDALRFGTN